MQIQPGFFHKGQIDKTRDDSYCKQHGIDNSNMDYAQTKGAIISDMTDGKLDASFFTNEGPMDRMKDLQLMDELGISPTGSREGNKAAILTALSEQKDSDGLSLMT